jgi:tetratricopeptide (TPR) repeat protein
MRKALKNKHNKKSITPDSKVDDLQRKLGEAVTFHNAGSLKRAQEIYLEILQSQPNHLDALHLSGVVALQSEQHLLSLDYLNKAIQLNPNFVEAMFHRGVLYKNLKQFDRALHEYSKVLELDSSHKNAHFDTGYLLEQLGANNRAIESYTKAIEIDPAFYEAKIYRVSLNRKLKRFKDAIDECNEIIKADPSNALAYSNMALIFYDQNKLNEALLWSDKALEFNPTSGLILSHRGAILTRLSKPEVAFKIFETAIDLSPNLAEIHSNYGLALQDSGQLEMAMNSFNKAVSLDELNPKVHFNRSLATLTLGQLEMGFAEYEWRHDIYRRSDLDREKIPQWDGLQPLFDKTLLIKWEQGLGDTIQFARYVTIVAGLAKEIIFEVQEPLVNIFSSLEGAARIVPSGSIGLSADFQCSLLSLPHFFGTSLKSIPARDSYLRAEEEKIELWKGRIKHGDKLNVGIVWSGGFRRDQPEFWVANERRNIPLELMAKLIHPDICFHSLQKGQPAESELEQYLQKNPEIALINHAAELKDFSDTAALIHNLDLVISVDTSTAHLAAALGKPTWIMNRFDTCWRWLLHRTDSPWYPTVRIYRQDHAGDWDGVISKIQHDLTSFKA